MLLPDRTPLGTGQAQIGNRARDAPTAVVERMDRHKPQMHDSHLQHEINRRAAVEPGKETRPLFLTPRGRRRFEMDVRPTGPDTTCMGPSLSLLAWTALAIGSVAGVVLDRALGSLLSEVHRTNPHRLQSLPHRFSASRSSRAACPPSVPLALIPSPCYGRTKSNKLCGDFRASMDLVRCTATLGSTPVQCQSSIMELEIESWLPLAWTCSKRPQPLLCVFPISSPNGLTLDKAISKCVNPYNYYDLEM